VQRAETIASRGGDQVPVFLPPRCRLGSIPEIYAILDGVGGFCSSWYAVGSPVCRAFQARVYRQNRRLAFPSSAGHLEPAARVSPLARREWMLSRPIQYHFRNGSHITVRQMGPIQMWASESENEGL
jgi:hypothetical protein